MVERSAPDELVCSVCLTRLRPVRIGCDRCAQPLPPVGPCRLCEDWPPGLVEVRSAFWLDEQARAMVHGLKYGGFTRLGATMATAGERLVRGHPTALVPVPLGRRRLRDRGYNQADFLARALGRIWGVPVWDRLIVRGRETRSQTELTPEERVANVSGAFSVANGAPEVTSRRGSARLHLVLVDDVFTTGATIVAAAKCLLAAGWETVGGITFARARTFGDRVLGDLQHENWPFTLQR